MQTKLFVATKAFIRNAEGKILILRESDKYKDGTNRSKFDVVGGRIKPGQHFKDGLLREIREETGFEVEVGRPFFVSEWRPMVKGEEWQIVAVFFECLAKSQDVILSDDHDEYKWIDPKKYAGHSIIENLIPAFEAYLGRNV